MKKYMKTLLIVLSLILLLSIAACQPADQPEPEGQEPGESVPEETAPGESTGNEAAEFYKGKTITLIVSHSPGGTTDIAARAMIPHLEELTGATVRLEYVDGAGGIRAANELYNNASKDGLTIGINHASTMLLSQLGGSEGVAFDVLDFTWLAHFGNGPRIYVTHPDKFGSAQDLAGKNLTIAAAVPGFSGGSLCDLVFCEILEKNGSTAKLVTGYEGLGGRKLAIQQKEADLTWQYLQSVPDIEEGLLKPLLSFYTERSEEIPDVPTIYEAGLTLESREKELLDMALEIGHFHLMMIAPPEVPEERANFLREVFGKIQHEEELIEIFKKAYMGTDFIPAEETPQKAQEIYTFIESELDTINSLIEKYR